MLLSQLVACGGGTVKADWQAPPADAAQRAVWMVRYLVALADDGGVNTPDDLSRDLHAAFTRVHVDQRTYPVGSCTGSIDRFGVEGSWFKDTPGGVAHMSYPGFAINGPGTTGSPVLTYEKSTSTCESLRLQDSVTLRFDNLPGFACITGDKLVGTNSGIKQGVATDGFIVFSYQGKIDQETSTTLGFSGRYGGPCLISADITRHLASGYRLRRAQRKEWECRHEVELRFCQANPPPTRREPGMAGFFPTLSPGWLDWDRRFMEEEQKTCRSLTDYFSAEPVEGPAVEAVPYRPGIPCRS